MARGLLLIDIQNDYFQGGAMTLTGMEHAADNAAAVLEYFRTAGQPVFHVQHISIRPAAGFFLPDTAGVEINERVRPRTGESLTRKNYPNAFRATALADTLHAAAVDELVIVGAMSHMCIDATTRAAFDLGFTCQVVADACATRDLAFGGRTVAAADVHAAYMAALASVYATVIDTPAIAGA
jgi:nicotinamidase-related amidase